MKSMLFGRISQQGFPACTANPDNIKTPASAGAFFLGLTGVVAALLLVGSVRAQTPQITATPVAADSMIQTTVVPVMQPPAKVVERTTVLEDPTKDMDRAERRAYKAKVYAAKIDSLVQSRDYMFFPNSMQQVPGGLIRYVFVDYFFLGLFVDHVEVHLPTERGVTQYVEMLNFDSMSIRNYRASRLQWGWTITFDITESDDLYHVDMEVSITTGETILTLVTPNVTMRYVGWLWDKKIGDPKFHRLD